MKHGTYKITGDVKRFQGQGAILRRDLSNSDNYLVQFDSLYLAESHSWVSLPRTEFNNLTGKL